MRDMLAVQVDRMDEKTGRKSRTLMRELGSQLTSCYVDSNSVVTPLYTCKDYIQQVCYKECYTLYQQDLAPLDTLDALIQTGILHLRRQVHRRSRAT